MAHCGLLRQEQTRYFETSASAQLRIAEDLTVRSHIAEWT
jgi:hypothetical protein